MNIGEEQKRITTPKRAPLRIQPKPKRKEREKAIPVPNWPVKVPEKVPAER